MNESAVQKRVRLDLASLPGCVMFRNNVGVAKYHDGTSMRTVRYGLCQGSSDLVGWTVVDGVAVFTAIETKAGKRPATEAQMNFIAAVIRAGGIAGIARNSDEAAKIVCDGVERVRTLNGVRK